MGGFAIFLFCICVIVIFVGYAEEDAITVLIGFSILVLAAIFGSIVNHQKKQTPQYKLWQKHKEIERIHQRHYEDSVAKQKEIWVYKRTKELEDSLIKLKRK